jgi:hypothetical protein
LKRVMKGRAARVARDEDAPARLDLGLDASTLPATHCGHSTQSVPPSQIKPGRRGLQRSQRIVTRWAFTRS